MSLARQHSLFFTNKLLFSASDYNVPFFRLFISSSGVGIMVSAESPLYLSFNQHGDQLLCLAATYDNTHYISPLAVPPVLGNHYTTLRWQIIDVGQQMLGGIEE